MGPLIVGDTCIHDNILDFGYPFLFEGCGNIPEYPAWLAVFSGVYHRVAKKRVARTDYYECLAGKPHLGFVLEIRPEVVQCCGRGD